MNPNHLAFVNSFIRAFTGIENEKEIKRVARMVARGKRYLWQTPIENGGSCLEGAKADLAYDDACKQNAYEFVFDGPFSFEAPVSLAQEHLSASAIREDGAREFYVFDKDYAWCYVVTHEGDACGPFFFKGA